MDILRLRLTVLGIFMVSAIGEQKIITAESGENVTLTGRAPNNNKPIIVVEWSRADLGNEYVLQYPDDQLDPEHQHPSFKNRVDLQDRQMKDGDVSVILKNVTINDTGTYECRVVQRRKKHRKRALPDGELISSIYLRVVAPPDQETITAVPGQNITLTCRASNNNNKIILVQWDRADLSKKVVVYRGDYVPEEHPSFKNRVDRHDGWMKGGDVSVILKNVMINDTGTYKCRVLMEGTSSLELISTITLRVAPPGPRGGTTEDGGKEDGQKEGTSVGLIIALSVAALVVVVAAVVGFLIYRKCNRGSSQPPDNKQSSEMSPVYLQVSSESPDPD
ncbi:uncharacterized protein LOC115776502 [Archocentrus centrarchus]|uniref:uncharacterized protein LOC115776502 n=1 Tax=Archocentrus centrarchus TaxID=63155 RepID=UPI0011EA4D37|nr:uncharacterized protein LOC115776502 [Archocentrus centrarchus]